MKIPSYNLNLDVSDLKDVIKALKQCYFPNHKFIHLGLQLGLLQPTLADIKANHKDDVESCLRECLTRWLCKADEVTENGSPTWDSLADALHKIEEKFAAEKIMAFSENFNNGDVNISLIIFFSCRILHSSMSNVTEAI